MKWIVPLLLLISSALGQNSALIYNQPRPQAIQPTSGGVTAVSSVCTPGGNSGSLGNCALTSTVPSGNRVVIVLYGTDNALGTVSACTDANSDTYTMDSGPGPGSYGVPTYVFSFHLTSGLSSGGNVYCTGGGTGYTDYKMQVLASTPDASVDGAATPTQMSGCTTCTSGTFTTNASTSDNCVSVVATPGTPTITWSSPYTAVLGAASTNFQGAWAAIAANSAAASTFTESSGSGLMSLVCYKQ